MTRRISHIKSKVCHMESQDLKRNVKKNFLLKY